MDESHKTTGSKQNQNLVPAKGQGHSSFKLGFKFKLKNIVHFFPISTCLAQKKGKSGCMRWCTLI